MKQVKANRVLQRELSGHSKHPLPTTQEKTLHLDITRWSITKSKIDYILCSQKWSSHLVNKRVQNAVLGCNLKNNRVISVCFQGKPFNIMVIQVYALTSNAKEAEVEQFQEDTQNLLELRPIKDVPFIIGDWNAKAGSQETPGVTGKFGL